MADTSSSSHPCCSVECSCKPCDVNIPEHMEHFMVYTDLGNQGAIHRHHYSARRGHCHDQMWGSLRLIPITVWSSVCIGNTQGSKETDWGKSATHECISKWYLHFIILLILLLHHHLLHHHRSRDTWLPQQLKNFKTPKTASSFACRIMELGPKQDVVIQVSSWKGWSISTTWFLRNIVYR